MSWWEKLLPNSVQVLVDQYEDYQMAKQVYRVASYSAATLAVVLVSGRLIHRYKKRRRLRRARDVYIAKLVDIKQEWYDRVLNQITAQRATEITSLTFTELRQALLSRKLTVVEVLRAFQYQAAVCDQKWNFICEPIREAEETAEALDTLSDSERAKLPLFGIPLSIKENMKLRGYNSNMGCSSLLGEIAQADAPTCQALKNGGAVPFIRCNIPQALLSFSSSNPIYGLTTNPLDSTREAGGSSGGDGAALACRSTVLGLGGDIAGSLRIPAAWCGISAFKPTSGALSYKGFHSTSHGQSIIRGTPGPMCQTVDGLIEMTKVLMSYDIFCLDPSVGYHPIREQELTSTDSLTIGYFDCQYDMTVCSAGRRAVHESVAMLKAQGHKLVPYDLPQSEMLAHYFSTTIFGDGGRRILNYVDCDEITKDNKPLMAVLGLPHPVKVILNYVFRQILPAYMVPVVTSNVGVASVPDWWTLTREVEAYRHSVVEDWRNKGIDAVLCPAMPIPAPPVGAAARAKTVIYYAMMWNVVNFPAGVVPITTVTPEDRRRDATEFAARDVFFSIMKKCMEGSEGLPVCAQIVTPPHHDERCLRLMKELESKAKFRL